MTTPIPRQLIRDFVTALGYDPDEVWRITIEPDELRVELSVGLNGRFVVGPYDEDGAA